MTSIIGNKMWNGETAWILDNFNEQLSPYVLSLMKLRFSHAAYRFHLQHTTITVSDLILKRSPLGGTREMQFRRIFFVRDGTAATEDP